MTDGKQAQDALENPLIFTAHDRYLHQSNVLPGYSEALFWL
jgi:hypothetical protein